MTGLSDEGCAESTAADGQHFEDCETNEKPLNSQALKAKLLHVSVKSPHFAITQRK